MDAAGKDDLFIATVGVGQAEIDIVDHADTVVLVLIAGSGDSIQALKAGAMEILDVMVVNKCDNPMTGAMVKELRGVLSLGPRIGWKVRIVKTEAATGQGIEELGERLAEHRPRPGRGHPVRAPPAQPARRRPRTGDHAAAAGVQSVDVR